ncbi:MAG: hypothetical protein ACQEW8_06600 [Actinomycetota bacterium]
MWQNDDLISQALETWGTFYRATLPVDRGASFSGIYQGDNDVRAVVQTQTVDATVTVEATPEVPGDSRLIRPPFDVPVEVYLDGTHLGSTGWHVIDTDWTAWVRVAVDAWLQVTIQGRWETPPATLELVRDRPAAV